ncbi:MAG: flagellar export protein FliJ [Nitrospira sp.]
MSLDSLQKLRAQTVEALMMELAQITQTLARSEERHRNIEAQIQTDSADYERHTKQGLTIEALLEWQARMDSQQTALRHARSEINQAASAWQHTKSLLVEASQECKLLELVAEKRQEAKRADMGRQEQRITDDAASRRYSSGSENRS